MEQKERAAVAALLALVVLQIVMLAALLTKTAPHPPLAIPLFGIGPFIGASLSAAVAAIVLGPTQSMAGKLLAIAAAGGALLSFGPQKYFDVQFGLIWPAVVAAQLSVVALLSSIVSSMRSKDASAHS